VAPSLAERLVVSDSACGRFAKEDIQGGDLSVIETPSPITESTVGYQAVDDFASFALRRSNEGQTLLAGLYWDLERLDLRTGRPVGLPATRLAYDDSGGVGGTSVLAWSADGTIAILGSGPIDTADGKALVEKISY
jgi:hypothetical protein